MNKKLIIINGVMGVGKTTISKMLYKELEDSFWLDGDSCWMMNPFKENDIQNGIRDIENINRSLEKLSLYNEMDTVKIDTTGKELKVILEEIKDIILE